MADLVKKPENRNDGFTQLWQDMDRLFAQTFQAFARLARQAGAELDLGDLLPKIDLVRQGTEIVATILVPGARPDSLEVTVTAEHLSVRGEIEAPNSYRAFHRSLPLPARVRPEAARTEQTPGRVVVRVPVA